MNFDPGTIAAVRRLDRVLKHHDHTLRRLRDSGSVLEREAFDLIEKRLRRLQSELESIHADRLAIVEGLGRLGVSFAVSDAAIGRTLRRALGVARVNPTAAAHAVVLENPNSAANDPQREG